MKHISLFRRYAVVVILLIVFSCDVFEQDALLPEKQIVVGQTEYYILPGTSTVIDLKSVINESYINASLKITRNPERGELTQLDIHILRYAPKADFTEGKDQFVFTVLSDGQFVRTETVTITMGKTTDDFPCALYAVEDKVNTTPDESVIIKFLDNDRICGVIKDELSTSIYSDPKNGQATLAGDSVIYTPNPGFVGRDSMIYKLTTSNGIAAFGIITVHIENCRLILKDFYVLDFTDEIVDQLSTTQYCTEAYEILNLWDVIDRPCSPEAIIDMEFIEQTNHSGAVWYCEVDFSFAYAINDQVPAKNDTALVRICLNAQCQEVSIYVVRSKQTGNIKSSWSMEKSSGDDLWGVFFLDETTGYAGGIGTILKTTNSGRDWQNVFQDYSVWIYDLFFLDTSNGYAVGLKQVYNESGQQVGTKGIVLRTTNGGQSWTTSYVGEGNWAILSDVHFVNTMVGFVGAGIQERQDGRIYKTMDGGSSWTQVYEFQVEHGLGSGAPRMEFVSPTVGYAHGFYKLLRTEDAGENWTTLNTFDFITSLNVRDGQLFALISDNYNNGVWKSSDGVDWTLVYEVSGEIDLWSYPRFIEFSPSKGEGFFFSNRWQPDMPLIHKTTDYGVTWTEEVIPVGDFHDIRRMFFVNDSLAFAVGTYGLILRYERK